MRKQFASRPLSLRFRRWSRKGYAAFISARRTVTMGCLTRNVVERLLRKNQSVHVIGGAPTEATGNAFEREEEEAQAIAASALIFLPLLAVQSVQSVQPVIAPAPAFSAYTNKRYKGAVNNQVHIDYLPLLSRVIKKQKQYD